MNFFVHLFGNKKIPSLIKSFCLQNCWKVLAGLYHQPCLDQQSLYELFWQISPCLCHIKQFLPPNCNVCIYYVIWLKSNGDMAVSTKRSSLLLAAFTGFFKSSRSHMFFKIGVLNNFTNFTGKYLCWSLLLIKLQVFRPATLLKRDSNTGVFLWNLWNF